MYLWVSFFFFVVGSALIAAGTAVVLGAPLGWVLIIAGWMVLFCAVLVSRIRITRGYY